MNVNPASRSFFVVEDEALIRMMLIDMIEELGHSVAAEAGRIEDALRLAQAPGFDIAILDINLGGAPSTPVAEILAQRAIPFVFASGYGERDVPETFRSRPLLCKPFRMDQLQQAIRVVSSQHQK